MTRCALQIDVDAEPYGLTPEEVAHRLHMAFMASPTYFVEPGDELSVAISGGSTATGGTLIIDGACLGSPTLLSSGGLAIERANGVLVRVPVPTEAPDDAPPCCKERCERQQRFYAKLCAEAMVDAACLDFIVLVDNEGAVNDDAPNEQRNDL